MDWTQIVISTIGLIGICYQAYCSSKNKKDKQVQTKVITSDIHDTSAVIKENSKLIRELKKSVELNTKEIASIKKGLSVNDRVSIASARSIIKRVYNENRDKKIISYADLEMLEELYSSYKGVKLEEGNTPDGYADACMDDIRTWQRVECALGYKGDHIAEYEAKIKASKK